MAYQDLVDDLILHAKNEADRIMGHAREEVRKMIADAMEEAEEMERGFEQKKTLRLTWETRSKKTVMAKELQKAELEVKDRVLEKAFGILESRLRSFPEEKAYSRVIPRLYGEIRPELGGSEGGEKANGIVIRADTKAQKILRSREKGTGIRFERLSSEEWGGLEAVLDGGRTCLKNTLRSRFIKSRPDLLLIFVRWMGET